jgi:hypothetical protein
MLRLPVFFSFLMCVRGVSDICIGNRLDPASCCRRERGVLRLAPPERAPSAGGGRRGREKAALSTDGWRPAGPAARYGGCGVRSKDQPHGRSDVATTAPTYIFVYGGQARQSAPTEESSSHSAARGGVSSFCRLGRRAGGHVAR